MPEFIDVPGISESLKAKDVPLTPAVVSNGLVFVAGLPPTDLETGEIVRGDIETQTRQVLENLKRTLETAGSDLAHVVKTTITLTNCAYYSEINEVYKEYFKPPYPSRSVITVGSWPMPFDIEIECIAEVIATK